MVDRRRRHHQRGRPAQDRERRPGGECAHLFRLPATNIIAAIIGTAMTPLTTALQWGHSALMRIECGIVDDQAERDRGGDDRVEAFGLPRHVVSPAFQSRVSLTA